MIVQVSSGSSGRAPRVVKRSLADIASIHGIVLSTWLKLFEAPPERVALLGGISHGQAARNFQVAGTRFESFDVSETARLAAYDPQFVACYPSIARELVADGTLELRSLRAFKLGGERVFGADLEKIQRRYPGLPVLEQLGCTEMPAVAMGIYRRAGDSRALVPQRHRFTFRIEAHAEWQPLVVRDDFPGASAPFADFYDTGDEVRWRDGFIVDIRRQGDLANRYHADAEALLVRGCVNVQLDLAAGELRYHGDVTLPAWLRFGDRTVRPVRRAPIRLPQSNKLPLVTT